MIDILLLAGVALCVLSVLMAIVSVARTQAPRGAAILLVLGLAMLLAGGWLDQRPFGVQSLQESWQRLVNGQVTTGTDPVTAPAPAPEAPAEEAPAETPATDAPASPAVETPAAETPAVEAPEADAPEAAAPAAEEPAAEEPAAEEPAAEAPAADAAAPDAGEGEGEGEAQAPAEGQ